MKGGANPPMGWFGKDGKDGFSVIRQKAYS